MKKGNKAAGSAFRLMIFFGALLLLIGPIQTQADTELKVLAKVEVYQQVDQLGVPVYAHLQGADGQDYVLSITTESELIDAGVSYTVLDFVEPAGSGKAYLIALERVAGARAQADLAVDVLFDDGRAIVARATEKEAEALVAMGFEIEWLNETPIKFAPASKLALYSTAIKAVDYNATVAEMMNSVTQSDLDNLLGGLTGDWAVSIGGSNYTITSRNTGSGTSIQKATQYVYEYFQQLGISASYHNWTYSSYSNRNVVGEISGAASPNEIVLITAHMDSMPSSGKSPGADDNGSGTAAVMLAAKILSQYDLKRTVRFVLFTGEEQGLYGSKRYAAKVDSDGDNVVAVLNLDMIAWDKKGGPVLRIHTRSTSNPGYSGDKALADTFLGVVDIYNLSDKLDPVIDADGISFSDHSSFWNLGMAAILAIEDDENDFCANYHTSSDTRSTLNMDYFTNYTKACVGTVAHYAQPSEGASELKADFTFTIDGLTAVFKDKSTVSGGGSIAKWQWNFGDGATSASQNPTHAYAKAGSYKVSLTVTDKANRTNTANQEVAVADTGDYCAVGGDNQKYEWIGQVDIGRLSNASNASGYSDFTAKSISAQKGESLAVSLAPGYAGKAYSESWKIWADLNHNNQFEDSETLFSKTGEGEVSGTITIPAGALNGPTRLRVAMQYNNAPPACGTFTYGEVEDYTLNIAQSGIEYCESKGNANNYEWIADVQIDRFSNRSAASGYTDFTDKVIDMTAGRSHDVTLTPGFAAKAYKEAWKIWIDLNRDGDFDDRDEALFTDSGDAAIDGSLTLPASAAKGKTRMRVSMRYQSDPEAPCGAFDYGEVEDYTVNIQ